MPSDGLDQLDGPVISVKGESPCLHEGLASLVVALITASSVPKAECVHSSLASD
jgi:hypothetical protein